MLVGIGLISSITESTSRIATICYQIPAGAGIGMVFAASYFPVLAPLPTKMNAAALSFFVFIRTFAQACNFSRSLSLVSANIIRRAGRLYIDLGSDNWRCNSPE